MKQGIKVQINQEINRQLEWLDYLEERFSEDGADRGIAQEAARIKHSILRVQELHEKQDANFKRTTQKIAAVKTVSKRVKKTKADLPRWMGPHGPGVYRFVTEALVP